MRFSRLLAALPVALICLAGPASAQKHDLGSSPPTAPPPKPIAPPQAAPLATPSLGTLQFSTVNLAVSAPQSLAAQLQTSDDRTRTAALAAIGAPEIYLDHGHAPFPHSVRLDLLALGTSNELDAILTVELEQHLVSAIFMPEDEQWHRIATVIYPTNFSNPATTPSNFLRADRALREPQHYTAIFHSTAPGANGDFTETEVHLRILNGRPTIITGFASSERTCDPTHQHPCDITQRWLQPDSTDPEHRVLLVTATGHDKPNEAGDPIAHAETFEESRLRDFSCQPFSFSDATLHFEPSGPAVPCAAPHDQQHEQPLH
ncbi:MAG TPA: hypothetical protein VK814_11645 [Acidobacteriaceae bacterium]|jgi:hypothetical protein|nr:hypothetical protein [Acidobacteriaceae bacterium]